MACGPVDDAGDASNEEEAVTQYFATEAQTPLGTPLGVRSKVESAAGLDVQIR